MLMQAGYLSSISILCSHLLLVSTSTGIHIYKIPPLQRMPANGHRSDPISISPLAMGAPGKRLRDALCAHHDGYLSAYAFTDGEDSLCILPPPGDPDPESNTVWYKLSGSCARNASRAILCQDYVDLAPITFECLTHFTRPGDCAGYARLGREGAPDPRVGVSICLPGYEGRTQDLSWDEESGCICVLYNPVDDPESRRLLYIDLI